MVSAPEIPLRTGSNQTLVADHYLLMDWDRARATLIVRWEGTPMSFELSVGMRVKRGSGLSNPRLKIPPWPPTP